MLREERNVGLDPYGSNFKPNPEEDAERVARLRLQDEAQAAAKAQVFFQIGHGGHESAAREASAADMPAGGEAAASREEGADREQLHKQGFMDRASDPKIYAAGHLQETRSPYELMAGTVIPAALVTGINSDLPGQMIATVTQNVYDTVTGNYLLIPQGSRMLGQYDAQVAYGQRRVLLVWTRLIMPDGSSITLDRLQGVDTAGYSGLEDRVDSHWGRIFAGAALSTLLGVNAQLVAQDQSVNSGSITLAFRQSSQDSLNQVGQQLTRKNPVSSACPMPRVELTHDHTHGPQGPSQTPSYYVLGAGPTGPIPATGGGPVRTPGPGISPSAEYQFHVPVRDTSIIIS